ncbi:hypothetical protein, partial [Candidatus Ichthyocystis hellenicum]|uniref:hypothetical protein n=1 Tax=Candidatus Ichthyocystis hellenicum TaxID=1561003 RepID=UPI001F5FD1BE
MLNKFKPIILKEFSKVIEEGNLGSYRWGVKMFDIAIDAADDVVKAQHKGLQRIISRARVIGEDGLGRKINETEIAELTKNVMQSSNIRLRSSVRRLWVSLPKPFEEEEDTGFPFSFYPSDHNSDSDSDFDEACGDKRSFWTQEVTAISEERFLGLKRDGKYSLLGNCSFKFADSGTIHDCILGFRARMLNKFRPIIIKEFNRIIEEGELSSYDWRSISIELFKAAMAAAKDVVKAQRNGLQRIISRVIVVGEDGEGRKINQDEIAELTRNVMQASNWRLREFVRRLWMDLPKPSDGASTAGTSTEAGTSGVASTSETSTEVSAAGTSVVATTSGSSAGGSSSVRLPLNLVEEDMLEFNSIMEEFSTSFEPVVCEVIDSMMEEMDIHSHGFDFDYILSKIAPVVSKRRYRFFTEGGFSARALSLLSRSRVMTADGSRITTDAERAEILNLSMTIITKGIDNFVGSYVSALLSSVAPVSRSEPSSKPSQLVEGAEEEGKGKSKAKGEKRRREEEYSDGVPAKFGSMLVHSEFNEDLDGMISEHIGSLREDVRSIRVDLESGYPHLTVEVRRDAMQEQSRVASDRLLSEFMGRV